MKIIQHKTSIRLLALILLALVSSLSLAHAQSANVSNSSVQIDPLLTQLLNQRVQKHIAAPVVASVLLSQQSEKIIENIRQTGATVITYSKTYPLVTIGLTSLKQLQALSQINGIEQIHSIYPSVGNSDIDPEK